MSEKIPVICCYYCQSEKVIDAWDHESEINLQKTERILCLDCKRSFSNANLQTQYKENIAKHISRYTKNG